MSMIKIIREVFTVLFGVGAIGFAVVFEADDPWLYLLGLVLILWGSWDIYKEVRDMRNAGDIADMSDQREEIIKKLGEEE